MDALIELRRCVQALAQPGAIQMSLFPDFACVGDELALEFEDAMRTFWETQATLSPSEAASLSALDTYLNELSGPQNEEFWTDISLLESDVRWERVRVLARAVRGTFGWPDEVPAKDGATYVGAGRVTRNE